MHAVITLKHRSSIWPSRSTYTP